VAALVELIEEDGALVGGPTADLDEITLVVPGGALESVA
jgi:hypothetical protein